MRFVLFEMLMAASILLAVISRGRTERFVGATYALAITATTIVKWVDPSFYHYRLPEQLIDLGLLTTWIAVSLLSSRFWPIWLVAFAAVRILFQAAGPLLPGVMSVTYRNAVTFWDWLILALIAFASWRVWKNRPA